jgi:hypothetical protein
MPLLTAFIEVLPTPHMAARMKVAGPKYDLTGI